MPKFMLPLATALLLGTASPVLAAPNVLASLKPVHSLVAGVMEGVGAPQLLVQGAASEHGYTLRPSDAARIEAADLVFWIGPEMETYMTGLLDTLGGDAVAVSLIDTEGLTLLDLREGGLFEAHDHGEDDHDHDHGHSDAHIWLDPANARLMVAAIAEALIAADPDNAEAYDANGRALAARLSDLQDSIATRLAPLDGKPFFVFHDAYHYFEHRFDIEATGSFTVNPEIAPGAGRLTEIRAIVEQSDAVCLFAEPQFPPRVIDTVAEGTGARIGTLDPLGATIPDGPELYFALLDGLADSLIDCLAD